MRNVQRQAFAGMLWTKQHYHYSVHRWLDGDPAGPPPPEVRSRAAITTGRTSQRATSVDARQVGVPWFAAWDTRSTWSRSR
jgi:hypothetical protein